jgi:hypothetical protein
MVLKKSCAQLLDRVQRTQTFDFEGVLIQDILHFCRDFAKTFFREINNLYAGLKTFEL